MARKGQTFRKYSQEFKLEAGRLYEQEGLSYQAVAKQMGIPSNTQVKQWIKKHRRGESLEHGRGALKESSWRRGRPKTRFASVEEERDYLKAQVEYLKKRYPNLHGD